MPRKVFLFKSDTLKGDAVIYIKGVRAKVSAQITLAQNLKDTDVIKMYLACSDRKGETPVRVGTFEVSGDKGGLEHDMIMPYDADTVILTQKNAYTEKEYTIASSFEKDEWDVSHTFDKDEDAKSENPKISSDTDKKISQTEKVSPDDMKRVKELLEKFSQNESYRDFLNFKYDNIESPVKRAEDCLLALKSNSIHSNIKGEGRRYFESIKHFAENYSRTDLSLGKDFVWYEITKNIPPVNLSSFYHIFSSPEASKSIRANGKYLLGIHRKEQMAAVAFIINHDILNPLSHISDCCTVTEMGGKRYCSVGIILAEDGQYFSCVE